MTVNDDENVPHTPNDHALHSRRVRSGRTWRLGFRGLHFSHKGEETLYEWDFSRRKLHFLYIIFFLLFLEKIATPKSYLLFSRLASQNRGRCTFSCDYQVYQDDDDLPQT